MNSIWHFTLNNAMLFLINCCTFGLSTSTLGYGNVRNKDGIFNILTRLYIFSANNFIEVQSKDERVKKEHFKAVVHGNVNFA